jgi:hypothetical protein
MSSPGKGAGTVSYREMLRPALPLAERPFREIGNKTQKGAGISRAPYGKGKQLAVNNLSAASHELRL